MSTKWEYTVPAVEVEVTVPCMERQRHPIRLRIVSWERWEVAYNPCEALLGRAFGLMAPCNHYVRENRNELKQEVVQRVGAGGCACSARADKGVGGLGCASCGSGGVG